MSFSAEMQTRLMVINQLKDLESRIKLRKDTEFKTLGENISKVLSTYTAIENNGQNPLEVCPPPNHLIEILQQFSQPPELEKVRKNNPKLIQSLNDYQRKLVHEYCDTVKWETPDKQYEDKLKQATAFSPKSGGAKNSGTRTGVYTFGEGDNKEAMLIKQGADIGETIAEYVGGNLYALTIPDNAAKCILVKDASVINPSINDLYVASIYEKADSVQDAFQAVNKPSRGLFAGIRARADVLFGTEESVVRKVLQKDAKEAGHSLAKCCPSVLWHGDSDFHTGNFVLVTKGNDKKFVKIDHGFSFFNFESKVVDVFNPFAGKVVDIDVQRKLKGGSLIEFYPTNHFWDFAVEKKGFYYSEAFIKACEDIQKLTPYDIQKNIHQSIDNVKLACGENAKDALALFGKRIGMTPEQIRGDTADTIGNSIENFMVNRLVERQASIKALANHCRTQANLSPSEHREKISDIVDQQIVKVIEHQSDPKPDLRVLKMVEQSNDSSILTVTDDGQLKVTQDFDFYNSGEYQHIGVNDFSKSMSAATNLDDKRHITQESINVLSEVSHEIQKEPGPKIAIDSSPTPPHHG